MTEALPDNVRMTKVLCTNPDCRAELGFVHFASPVGAARWFCPKCGWGAEARGTAFGTQFVEYRDKKSPRSKTG